MISKNKIEQKETHFFRDVALPCVFSIILAIIVVNFVGFSLVCGDSMNPTLENHDYLFTIKDNTNLSPGDIITFRHKDEVLIKRVIAVGDDSIIIDNGEVTVNGINITEKYIQGKTEGYFNIKVPEDKVFVMGDNRENSLDSRYIGVIDKNDVIGVVKYRICPINKFGNL